ncbi:MAG: hypothetical protein HN631_01605, partial [Flavobacteriaceae bacterium]|nr:hypothetical protein [Flavobacteriaceae bacterium]
MKKILILFISILILSCNNSNKKSIDSIPMTKINELKTDGEWVSLIQQNTMDGWHYFQDNGKKTGWDIKDGVLTFTSANAKGKG